MVRFSHPNIRSIFRNAQGSLGVLSLLGSKLGVKTMEGVSERLNRMLTPIVGAPLKDEDVLQSHVSVLNWHVFPSLEAQLQEDELDSRLLLPSGL